METQILEVTHHGSYRHEETHVLDDLKIVPVLHMLRASAYTYNPGVGVCVRIIADLTAGREASHGWSRYTIVGA